MISVRGRGRPRRKRLSIAPSIAPPSSSLPPKSESSEQPDRPQGLKSPAAATSIPKYSKKDLQGIFKSVLEAWAPAPAPVISKEPWEKLKARSPDVYHGKSHMDYYNFCQQCEDYFATAGATGPTQIPFAASSLRDRINFYGQQYKRNWDTDNSVPITWDEFKVFLCQSLGDSQTFVDTYWGKIKRDSSYQLEEVLDWAAHLEHLQAIFQEFDPAATLNDEIIIRYFREGLRPSIRAQLDARGRELDSWEEVIKKTIDAKAKVSL